MQVKLFSDLQANLALSSLIYTESADGSRQKFPKRLVNRQILASTLIALSVVLFMPQLGNMRYYISVLCVCNIPLIIFIESQKNPVVSRTMHFIGEITKALLATALHPFAYHGGVLYGTVYLIVALSEASVKIQLISIALWNICIGLIGYSYGIEDLVAIITITFGACITSSALSEWRKMRQDNILGRMNLLITTSDAILWEYHPDSQRISILSGKDIGSLGLSQMEFGEKIKRSLLENLTSPLDLQSVNKTDLIISIEDSNNSTRWFKLNFQTNNDEATNVLYGTASDITELEVSRKNLRRRAERDSLTGLANRNGLATFLQKVRIEGPKECAVIIADVDRFKDINDTLGHIVGDNLIIAIANRLANLGNESACVARIGGDEFAVAVAPKQSTGPSAKDIATDLATKIIQSCDSSYSIDGLELVVSISIGIASGIEESWDELLRRADIAMYKAKRLDSKIEVYKQESQEFSSKKFRLQAELVANLEKQVELFFQPVVDAHSKQLVGLEGLARWPHPTDGLIMPNEFLDLINSAGLTNRFDIHIMGKAIQTASNMAAYESPIAVAANISPRSLWSPSLSEALNKLLTTYPLAAGNFTIEITEHDILADSRKILPILNKFREIGVNVALDDYGTGASSLIRLRNLPFTAIKIDRSFISGILTDKADAAIVRSTIDLANELGLTTIAEGVEKEAQAELLRKWGCHKLQGYLYGKAIQLNQIHELECATSLFRGHHPNQR